MQLIMEDCSDDRKTRKRAREENSLDPEVDSPGLKITRVESANTPESEPNRVDSDADVDLSGYQLTRLDSSGSSMNSNDSDPLEAELLNSPEAKRMQDNLLDLLDEADTVPDRDLDSVMRSFLEEIMIPGEGSVGSDGITGLGETQPDLGYLLEASDDELGLPSTGESVQEKSVEQGIDSVKEFPEAMGFNGFMAFEDEIPSYDSLELGFVTESGSSNVDEFVPFDGLFEYPAPEDGLWRYESLQAQ